MQKLYRIPVLIVMMFLFYSPYADAQLQRNPVLEYCTGTWCQYCPCGHSVIKDNILPTYPNAVILGYHGPTNSSDPYRNFNGNGIITNLTFSSYPTGIIDRTSGPVSRSAWYNNVAYRNTVNATMTIDILKTYNETSRQLDISVLSTALENLTGSFKVNVVLTEDGLKYAQTGNAGCIGGTDYVHDHVVRSMLNGAAGDLMNTNEIWPKDLLLQKDFNFIIPAEVNAAKCHLAVFIYKVNTTFYLGEIQQAKQWTLIGNIVPVELTAFTASIEGKGILLSWETISETNNHGFVVERSTDGESFIPAGFVKGNGTTTEHMLYSFRDKPEVNGIYYYRLKQQDYDGSANLSEVLSVKMDIPSEYNLAQNYPNPFNPLTMISFSLPVESYVSLKVYDVTGRELQVLVSEVRKAGTYEVSFDAADLTSGIYFYTVNAGSFTQSKKLVVLK